MVWPDRRSCFGTSTTSSLPSTAASLYFTSLAPSQDPVPSFTAEINRGMGIHPRFQKAANTHQRFSKYLPEVFSLDNHIWHYTFEAAASPRCSCRWKEC